MSSFRSYLPNAMGNYIGYIHGIATQTIQPYISTRYDVYHIIDNIYIGDLPSALNNKQLKKDGITHIISIFNGSYSQYPDEFKYKHIHINDDPWLSISKHFDDVIEFIEEAQNKKGKVLIHCMCGISRSATLIAAYLIKNHNYTTEQAIHFLKNKKKAINPNDGFIVQLERFENKIKAHET